MATDYTYGLNIAQDAFERAGIKGTDITDKMKRYVNAAYFDLLKRAAWPFALAHPPGIIDTLADVSDEITITQGSKTATITTDSGTTDFSGRKIQQDAQQIPYRIITHSGTTLTLDATWKEDSASGDACTIFQDEYDLATDCLKPWSMRGRNSQIPLRFSGGISMHNQWDIETYGNYIIDVSLIQQDKVRMKPWLKDAVTIEYLYVKEQSPLNFTGTGAGDTPVVPAWDRKVLADMALMLQLLDWLDTSNSVAAKVETLSKEIERQISNMRSFYIIEEDSFSA